MSAYIEKMVVGRTGSANIHHTKSVFAHIQKAIGFERSDLGHFIKFRQFVEFISTAPAENLNSHWRTQSLNLEGITNVRLFQIDMLDDIIYIIEERSGMTLNRQARTDMASFFNAPPNGFVGIIFKTDYDQINQTQGF